MITREEFLFLYEKNLSGRCTPEEKQLLESFQDEISMPDDIWESDLGDKERIYQTIKTQLQQHITQLEPINPRRNYGWMRIAASILVVLGITGMFWEFRHAKKKPQLSIATVKPVQIFPGGNKAYLTTSNGIVIMLNNVRNGKFSAAGISVNKVKDGVLVYDPASASNLVAENEKPVYKTITTPRGGQYQVVLADGTKVWLNSASSLTYPAVFKGRERNVQLSGEAYFEVVKNVAHPFSVMVNGINVQDLGTHFNIRGYADEQAVKTTLLEGSVKLVNNNHEALLKPGEQGALNSAQTAFEVENVDVDDAIAWKNGLFAFNNEDIHSIMNSISRWYDVDVIFPANFKRKNFGGTISRFKDVNQVLNALELTGSIHFKVEGRRIIVMP
jgi:transmembrane sensor